MAIGDIWQWSAVIVIAIISRWSAVISLIKVRAVIAVKMRKVRLTMREKEGETVPKKGALPTFNWTSPGELYFGILNIVCGDEILWKYSDDPNWSQFHKQSLYSYYIFWDDSPSWDVLWVLWSQNWPNGNDNFTARRLNKVCGYFMGGVYLALMLNKTFFAVLDSMKSIAIW